MTEQTERQDDPAVEETRVEEPSPAPTPAPEPIPEAPTTAIVEAPPGQRRAGALLARSKSDERWFTMKSKGDGVAEIAIYGDIGPWDVTAKQFVDELKALGDVRSIDVRINSRGGDVWDGVAIHNALAMHAAEIVVHVDGLAASAASLIAMAGDKIVMPSNTMMMIHNPSALAWGTAEDMRKTAETLDRITGSLVAIYSSRSGQSAGDVTRMLDEETWFTAEEAKTHGFADEVTNAVRVTAQWDLSPFLKAPQQPAIDLGALRVDAAAAAQARSLEIVDLCALAKMPERAGDFIRANASIDSVRKALLEAAASAAEQTDIRTQVPPSTERKPTKPAPQAQASGTDAVAIYASRNAQRS